MNIFFDLDGTILDSRERLYRLFQHLVPQSKFSFDEYWELKRNKISHKQILLQEFNFAEEKIHLFQENWMNQIEAPQWLSFDKPFLGTIEYLQQLREKHHLFVVTARQFSQVAQNQIEECGLNGIFEQILVTNQKSEKSALIEQSKIQLASNDWLIGDTGKDIETGKKLGLQTAAVLSGFLNRQMLEKYNPKLIVNSIIDLDFEQLDKV